MNSKEDIAYKLHMRELRWWYFLESKKLQNPSDDGNEQNMVLLKKEYMELVLDALKLYGMYQP